MSESEVQQFKDDTLKFQASVERLGGRYLFVIVTAVFAAAVWATTMKYDNAVLNKKLDVMEQKLSILELRYAEQKELFAARTADRFTSRHWDAAASISAMQTPPVFLPPFQKIQANTPQP